MNQSDYEVNVLCCTRLQARENKRVCARYSYGSYYGLVETLLRDLLANHVAQQCKPKQNQNYSPLLIDNRPLRHVH